MNRKREQICLAFSFPIFNVYNDSKFHLNVLEKILYGSMTSRLWMALREINPIVYGLSVKDYLYEECGVFRIRLTFDSSKIENVLVELNKKNNGELFLDIGWSSKENIGFIPSRLLDKVVLSKLPSVCGVAFVKKDYLMNHFELLHHLQISYFSLKSFHP